jgi:glycosyltransferase involved in cell wall biosynthesis
MPIRVGLDAQSLTGKNQTGLGVYAKNLARIFEKHPETIDFRLLWPKDRRPFEKTLERLIWEQYHLILAAAHEEVDLLHSPCFSVPRFTNMPRVVTAHDLIVLEHPNLMPPGSRWYFSKWIPSTYHYADQIISVSRTTKDIMVNSLQINPDKITVIHHGIGPAYVRAVDPTEINLVRFKYHVPMEFFLMVGSFEPRKNVLNVIEAFAKIANSSNQLKLLLVGNPNAYQRQMRQKVKELDLEENIIFPGYIPDKELAVLYSVTTALIFSSSAEGFGLPIIEAMATGCPVIGNNLLVFHEIGGDAIAYIEAEEPDTLVEQMKKMLFDSAYRGEYARRGMARSMKYSWEQAAEETLKVYMRVLSRHGKSASQTS